MTAAGTASEASSSQFSITIFSSELQLAAQINEADIGKVKVGQKVTFTVNAYPDREFTGRLVSLSPLATTSNSVQVYDAVISIDDYKDLRAGMPASITIIVGESLNVLAVPQSALDYGQAYLASSRARSRSGAGTRSAVQESSRVGDNAALNERASIKKPVVVLAGNEQTLRWVETGLSDDVSVEIKSGLKEGDTVITGSISQKADSSASTSDRSSNRNYTAPGFPGGPFMR